MDLYNEAADIVKNVLSKKDSLKTLVFSSKIKNKKALYAVSCESLRYRGVLQELLGRCGKLQQEKALAHNEHLATVLLYEHLLGRGIKGKYSMCFKKHKFVIHTQAELMKIRAGVSDLKQLVDTKGKDQAVSLPKYVRINTLLVSPSDACRQLTDHLGYEQLSCDSHREVVSGLAGKQFTTDPDIPNLFVFPPNTDFHDMKLYKTGKIIVQDKASCFPAYILSPPAGATVIDCCAAPGNKTSHLASIMGNKGVVYAFDKSKRRLATLKQQMARAGASSVVAECRDFLAVDPLHPHYKDVKYILVDPSCSGSGIVNRLLQHTDETDSSSPERLAQLSRFQISILSHALGFPAVRRVVYSTCSVHTQENEQVVEEVLAAVGDRFTLKLIMPNWPHRGLEDSSVGKYCIRMSQDDALTNGFFVACFERIETAGDSDDSVLNRFSKSEVNTSAAVKLARDTLEVKKMDKTESLDAVCVENGRIGKRKKGASVGLECVPAKVSRTADTDFSSVKKKEKKANACKKKKKKNKKHKQ